MFRILLKEAVEALCILTTFVFMYMGVDFVFDWKITFEGFDRVIYYMITLIVGLSYFFVFVQKIKEYRKGEKE